MSTRIRVLTVLLTAVTALTAVAAQAQTSGDRPRDRPGDRRGQRIEDIRVAVWTPREHSETALLRDGETLRLEEGQTVILRVVAPDKTNPASERVYLAARYSVERGDDRVSLHDADIQKGWVELTAREGRRDRRDPVVVRWELAERALLEEPGLARGAIRVEVEPGPYRYGEEAVAELYRGILLREPDAGARGWVERVSRGGYAELLAVAQAIAESRESEIEVYTRGACNQQRLIALYRNLLGVEPAALDQGRWRAELDRMGRGDIAGVVLDIVRSPAYRERHEGGRQESGEDRRHERR
jgi:hypothetical protein